MDALVLARVQFALTAMFHYIYPPLTIGMGVIIFIMATLRLKRKEPVYEEMLRFWVHLFGINFAVGVATGIVLEFQFGTNWAPYSRFVGDMTSSARLSPPKASSPSSLNRVFWPCWSLAGTRSPKGRTGSLRSWWL